MKRKVLEMLTEKPEDMSGVTEVDGKFYREIEIDDGSELKDALKKERKLREEFESKMSKFDGVDLEEYKKLLKTKEDGLSDAEKYERSLAKLNKKIEEMEALHKSEVDDLNGKLKNHHLDAKSRKAAIKSGVLPEYVDDALTISERFRSLDDKGNIVIVDKDGDPTGTSLDDFFGKQFKEQKPLFYKGISGGSGTPNGGGMTFNKDLMKLPPKERLNAAREAQQV